MLSGYPTFLLQMTFQKLSLVLLECHILVKNLKLFSVQLLLIDGLIKCNCSVREVRRERCQNGQLQPSFGCRVVNMF
jgi:hypothetical protein